MLIVPVCELTAGMVLDSDLASASAKELNTLLTAGTRLTDHLIKRLKDRGIKSVCIADGSSSNKDPDIIEKREIKNQHISNALADLNSIFGRGEEIDELNDNAVEKIDDIACNIIADLEDDSEYLVNEMIALQNYDDYTYKHCLRVAILAAPVAEKLELSRARSINIVTAALLHDIGKSSIEHDIIVKPGKLTDEEFAEIKKHPVLGCEILRKSGHYNQNVLHRRP